MQAPAYGQLDSAGRRSRVLPKIREIVFHDRHAICAVDDSVPAERESVMSRPTNRLALLLRLVLLSLLLVIGGCLPSPTKPLGGAKDEEKKPDDSVVVDQGTEKLPDFGPAPDTLPKSDSTAKADLPAPLPGSPLAGPPPTDKSALLDLVREEPKNANALPDAPNRLLLPKGPDTPDSSQMADALPPIGAIGGPTLNPLPDAIGPINKTPTEPPSEQLGQKPSQPLDLSLSLTGNNDGTPAAAAPDIADSLIPPTNPPVTPIPDLAPEKPLLNNDVAVGVEASPEMTGPQPQDPTAPADTPTLSDLVSSKSPTLESPAVDRDPLDTPPPTPKLPANDVPLLNVNEAPLAGGPVSAPPLIRRSLFFGTPARSRARISPDGKRMAFIAERDGSPNVFVAPIDDLAQAKPVTDVKGEGLRNFLWAFTNRHIVFLQETNPSAGVSEKHVCSVNLETNQITDLTRQSGINAYVASVSHKSPAEILIGVNDRNPRLHDLYRTNIVTGESRLVEENTGFEGYEVDDDYQVRIAYRRDQQGGRVYSTRPNADQPWQDFLTANPEDALSTGIVGFNKTGDQVYFVDGREGDKSVLKVIDLAQGKEKRLAENQQADVSGTLLHPTEKHIEAVTFTHNRQKWKVLDERINADLEYLHTVEDGELQITSRTLDDTVWTVVFQQDDAPPMYYLYRRSPKTATLLFNSRPELVDAPLVKMHPVEIPTRDGMNLVSYLSLPYGIDRGQVGRPDQPIPLVLLVHGGPWSRDFWGFNDSHQFFANRGYAVLSVNYRGSIGFGKTHTNAGNREWGGKMQDDLVDAVRWSVNQGIAMRDRVAIMGGSYGGYATLAGLTFTPDLFACGVDIAGPSNLATLREHPPSNWGGVVPLLDDRIGSIETPQSREFLMSRSPSRFLNRIKRPLLIAQGANDPRATTGQADAIVQAMRSNGVPVTYLLYPDESHGLKRPENRMAFYALAENFLARNLGGRAQPIGSDLSRSSVKIPVGRDIVADLSDNASPEQNLEAPAARAANLPLPSLD